MDLNPKPATEKRAYLGATKPTQNIESWVKVIKRGNAFIEFIIGIAALPPMDQKPLGIALGSRKAI